jgi:beta-glucanase (GH16 family)
MTKIYVFILLCACFQPAEAQSFLQNKVIAHRGAWKNTGAPQNSIASLQQAIRLGCTGSEFDIRLTKDEVLVINHDPEYQGMDIEKTDYAELLKKPLKNGEVLPTLKQYLKAGKKQRNTKLIAEIKPSPAGKARSLLLTEKTVAQVRKMKMRPWVVYITFDYDIAKKVRALDKEAHIQYLNGDVSAEKLKADGISGADYHFSVFQKDESWIANARKTGIATNAWTVNDTLVMDYLLARNIDYLTTDEPEKALLHTAFFAQNQRWRLAWSDEFNYKGLPDSTKWTYDTGGHGWGNNELQYYTRADTQNVKVNNGSLFITARKQNIESSKYTSARLITRTKSTWTYGKMEIRARLPKGRGIWPAIWMLGDNITTAGWPRCGEIDIMEHVGYDPDTVVGTVHTMAYNHTKGTQIGKRLFLADPYTAFHVYGIDWNAESMDFTLDGKPYLHIKNEHKSADHWPFNQSFYLLLNVAVGGNWGGHKGVDDAIFPTSMEVDYVRVYQER